MCLCAYVVKKLKFLSLSLIILSTSACNTKVVLQEIKTLPHYPSASGIEYRDGMYYIIGDDAKQLLILDSSLNSIDSITLYDNPEKRIPKAVKPDLEAMALVPGHKLFITGSGSLAPQRYIGWLIDPIIKQKDSIRLDTFYQRILLNGIRELNIEGMTVIPGAVLLSNRGNKGYPKNHLVFTRPAFWLRQSETEIHTMLAGSNPDSTRFSGVSGLAYAAKTDKLIMTVSTEDTRSSMDDGAIGKSYLWIIRSISSKKTWKAVNPDTIIDLDAADPRFKGHKIESVCITRETKKFLYLLLAADNDDGSSTLFKLVIPNN